MGDCGGGSEEWLESVYAVKEEITESADRSTRTCETKREVKKGEMKWVDVCLKKKRLGDNPCIYHTNLRMTN